MCCALCPQHKNLLILYDAIGTLADSVGSNLNRPVSDSAGAGGGWVGGWKREWQSGGEGGVTRGGKGRRSGERCESNSYRLFDCLLTLLITIMWMLRLSMAFTRHCLNAKGFDSPASS